MSQPLPIDLQSDTLSVSVLPQGATLAAVRFGRKGRNLVLGFADPSDHFKVPVYAGALVGPVANRITEGKITIDGTTYQMPRNENGTTCLHSGPFGLHMRAWEVTARRASEVTLAIRLEDADCGLPGTRDISVTYRIGGRSLWIEIVARTDQTTPMNIAAHPYWCLDECGDVSRHQLQVEANSYLPVDARNLPTGDILSVAGTSFDFRTRKPVPVDPALDLNFCLESGTQDLTPKPCATLTGADGTALEIATTAPGLQVYNGAFLPALPGVLDGGKDLRPYGGIALEPQMWPDAPHHPQFPDILLHPGHIWRQITRYTLTPPAR